MRERGRMLLIFTIAGAVLGAGALYLLLVVQPSHARADARAEIERWEVRWKGARECLVGSSQASAAVAEAMAIRELGADLTNRGTCSKLVGELTRGPGDATEIDAVERAWQAIDFAASKIATAYVTSVAPTKKGEQEATDELATVLAEMDAAHAALRTAADMAPLPARAAAALPKGALVPIDLGARRVTILHRVEMSAGHLVVHGGTEGGNALVVHAAGKQPIVMQVGDAVRSFPDLGWGAVGADDRLDTVTLDALGQASAPTTLKTAGETTVRLAVGSAANGFVVFDVEGRLSVARSESGKLSVVHTQQYVELDHAIDPAGRAVVAWSESDGALRGAVLQPGAPFRVVELGSGHRGTYDRTCLTDTTGWVASGDQLVSLAADGTVVPRVLPEHSLVGCSRTAALLHVRGSLSYAACTMECRIVELPNAHPTAIPVLVGDRVAAVAARRRVLAVWREAAGPSYFAFEEAFAPLYAISDGTSIDVLGRTARGLVIARVPAR